MNDAGYAGETSHHPEISGSLVAYTISCEEVKNDSDLSCRPCDYVLVLWTIPRDGIGFSSSEFCLYFPKTIPTRWKHINNPLRRFPQLHDETDCTVGNSQVSHGLRLLVEGAGLAPQVLPGAADPDVLRHDFAVLRQLAELNKHLIRKLGVGRENSVHHG